MSHKPRPYGSLMKREDLRHKRLMKKTPWGKIILALSIVLFGLFMVFGVPYLRDYMKLKKFVYVTDTTYPEKFQRLATWEKKSCAINKLGYTKVPTIEENGYQDLSYYCENICDWIEECLEQVPYNEAPWLYQVFKVEMPSLTEEFPLVSYVSADYDRDTLYEALYTFIDERLSTADYNQNYDEYGSMQYVEEPTEDEILTFDNEPDCTYEAKDGTIYCMMPIDRAAGSSYYMLVKTTDGGETYTLVNSDPYRGSGGQAAWIEFIDDSDLGFACLTYSGGDEGMLYRTDDRGKTFTIVNYPSAQIKLSDGTIYNPFVIPEKVWKEDGKLYLLAGQSPWSGDYYSEELDKYPSGLYVSQDDGISFEYLGEQ